MTYPSMLRRSLSTSIDTLLVIGIAMAIAALLSAQSEAVVAVRVLLIASLVVNYEPVLVSKSRTVGQWLVGIRVRRRDAPGDRIGLPQAYLRTLIKLFLGGLSFLMMGFNKQRRALHDLAVGSIVLDDREDPLAQIT